jgi:dTMP kinase
MICDRFADSTVAYQGYGRGFDVERLLDINAFATGDTVPDLTLLLDVAVPEGAARILRRNKAERRERDRFEKEDKAFHERVRNGYLELAARFRERYRVLDTSRPEETVAGDIWDEVRRLIEMRAGRAGREGPDA